MRYVPIVYDGCEVRLECFVTAKCGSSSLEELFFERLPLTKFSAKVKNLRILVTRNPWYRLASYYSDKMVNRGFVKVTENFRAGRESSGYEAGGKNVENASFAELVEELTKFNGVLDPHLQPQCQHMGITTNDIQKFDFFIRVESMNEDLKKLSDLVGFPSEILQNLSEGVSTKSNSMNECVSHLTVTQHRERGGVPKNYESLYNEELIESVAKLYKEDVINFGYEWRNYANS